jgi:ribosomal protein L1
MDEVNVKRRDARRRRILENSESRLRKITRNNPEEIKGKYIRDIF